nr:hypothetical protein [uncultured Butyrivibrio sp.]
MKLHRMEQKATGTAVFGCMWKKGELPKEKTSKIDYFCTNENGKDVLLQSRVTAYWPDGSIKWTAHCADASDLGEEIEVRTGEKKSPNPPVLNETEDAYEIRSEGILAIIRKNADELFEVIKRDKMDVLKHGKPVLKLEEPQTGDSCTTLTVRDFVGKINKIEVEETGEIQTVIRYEGIHVCNSSDQKGAEKIPFIIRVFFGTAAKSIKIQHTFLYDGDENKDFLKGIGISFESPLSGPVYNRHVKITGDHGVFHEVSAQLCAWRPRVPESLYQAQIEGKAITEEILSKCGDAEIENHISQIIENSPHWDSWTITQDSALHFRIRKKLSYDDVCQIDALSGNRSKGGVAFGSESGSVMIGFRDFWEKNPAGISVLGLSGDTARTFVWFYSPEAESYDFRHYAHRGYNQVCYEGYDYKGADPDGIAVTSECELAFSKEMIPEDETLLNFAENVNHPPVYIASPEFYHEMRAFGYWSLPKNNTEVEKWLEDQLDRAFEFYKREVDQRKWYGLFNYGDFMHTYDRIRHQWKYDVGGYAWDNTELVPTLWLWNYFLRTGRADVYRLAEKLSRHASEVDVYHFGKYKGLGSRHNVRHWGCPCKEARIAMAAHHRVFYYLTGDRRLEDIFEELKDNENSFLNKDPLGDFYEKEKMNHPSHARSGPDWSSLVSNWMTQWERKGDLAYREKIVTGIRDIEKAPLRLASGPDFEFDPASAHLYYIGERTTGGTHLQVCMGAPTVWMETADLLEMPEFNQMLVELGRFALLPRQMQLKECNNLIQDREYTFPFMFSGLGAYAAAGIIKGNCSGVELGKEVLAKDYETEGHECAKRTWQALLSSLIGENNADGFLTCSITDAGNHHELSEIPWISTNFTAQWCLNVIIALDFIESDLPKTLKDAENLVGNIGDKAFRRA